MSHLPQLAEYVGLLAIVTGCAVLSPVLGLIVGGLLCVGLAQLVQLRRERGG